MQRIEEHAGDEIRRFAGLISQTSVPSVDGTTVEELRSYLETGTLSKLTVPLLKNSVKTLGLKPASNKKADLIASVTQYFDS